MTLKLSTLSILLGLGLGLPQIYGLMKPKEFAASVRKFPRNVPIGIALMLLATAWFLWILSQEAVSDFANYQSALFILFAGVGIGTCVYVQDFIAVRGLAVLFLLDGEIDGRYRPADARKNPLDARDSNLGLCPGRRRHLAHALAVAPA